MASRIPDGIWVCEQGHRWSHPPQPTVCPICGAFERIEWLNWDDVRDAIAAKKAADDLVVEIGDGAAAYLRGGDANA